MLFICSSHLPHAGYTPRPSDLPPFVEEHILRSSSSCKIIHCTCCLQLSAFKIFSIPIFTKSTFLEKFYVYLRYKITLKTFQDVELKLGADWHFLPCWCTNALSSHCAVSVFCPDHLSWAYKLNSVGVMKLCRDQLSLWLLFMLISGISGATCHILLVLVITLKDKRFGLLWRI